MICNARNRGSRNTKPEMMFLFTYISGNNFFFLKTEVFWFSEFMNAWSFLYLFNGQFFFLIFEFSNESTSVDFVFIRYFSLYLCSTLHVDVLHKLRGSSYLPNPWHDCLEESSCFIDLNKKKHIIPFFLASIIPQNKQAI